MDTTMRLYGIGTVALLLAVTQAPRARAADLVKIDSGMLQGKAGTAPGVRVFEGIPYAAPPVGKLRWRAPEPVSPWTGVRAATAFGPRAMQRQIYSDMFFRDAGPSEDCLYLNVWTPAKTAGDKLPVMVWIYGGGFEAGASSEPRQDGTRLAAKGVVVVSMNYRLGIFGFFTHPWLTAEAGAGPFGSYGIMDQAAALRWVKRNIAAFGGNPGNVTIFGESAGSYSVSLQMASPASKGLFQKAIGESGSMVGTRRLPIERNGRVYTVEQGESWGTLFSNSVGAKSLEELRAIPAEKLLTDSQGTNYKEKGRDPAIVIDGRLFLKSPYDTFTEGSQAHVPLLAGWNADENRAYAVFAKNVTVADFTAAVKKHYPTFAGELLKAYPASTDAEAVKSTGDMACDGFIVASVWNWVRKHAATGRSPVYVYRFDRAVPVSSGSRVNGSPITGDQMGATHATDIPYVFGVLDVNKSAPWTPGDWALSDLMATYWSNFAKTGSPVGAGLPAWPRYEPAGESSIMHLDVQSGAKPEAPSDLVRLQVWDRETPPSG